MQSCTLQRQLAWRAIYILTALIASVVFYKSALAINCPEPPISTAEGVITAINQYPIRLITTEGTEDTGTFSVTYTASAPYSNRKIFMEHLDEDFCGKISKNTYLTKKQKEMKLAQLLPGDVRVLFPSSNSAVQTAQILPEDTSSHGLRLEVYLVQRDDYPEHPAGTSLAIFDDDRPPLFGYGAVMEAPELAAYERHRLGLHWSGRFEITEEGRHLFSFVGLRPAGTRFPPHCHLSVRLGGEQLFNGQGQFRTTAFDQEVTLSRGIYSFDCWIVCNRWEQGVVEMRMRSPNDRVPSPAPVDRFRSSP